MDSDPALELGALEPRALVEARLALHLAAQPLAAAAYALLPAPPDHSHSNLLWSHERTGFLGRALPRGGRLFLDARTMRTLVLDGVGETRAEVDVVGRTLAQALEDLARALRKAGERVPEGGLMLPGYDLPGTPVARGAAFAPTRPEALAELGRWFALGASRLGRLAAERLAGAEVRGWPHHFDLAALLALDGDPEGPDARSVGAGLSPGDESYDEPYFYVSPWPAPDPARLPALPAGAHWHTEGFTSAVLKASEILRTPAPERSARVAAALDAMTRSCLELVRGQRG